MCPNDTVGCSETSSPDDVIEVVIERKTKTPAGEAGVGLERVSEN